MNAEELVSGFRERLVRFRGQYRQFCNETGVDYSWLSKFANGKIPNPTVQSLEDLGKALEQWEGKVAA